MLLASARVLSSLLFLLTLMLVGASPAGAKAVFQDARGENPDGVDITSVSVLNDIAGLLTFRVNIPSRPKFTEDMRVRIWFDSDSNRATGLTASDVAGRDYFILWDRDGVRLYRCSASGCTNATAQRTLGSSYRGGATFTIDASEIKAKRFKFTVEAAAGIAFSPVTRGFDFSKATWDFAPERDRFWSYNVRLGPSRLLAKSISTTPARPQAGEKVIVRLAVARDDTGTLLSSGRVTCAARIGPGTVRPSSQGFSGRRATCVFAIPPGAGGQRLRGSVNVAFAGRRVTKTFSRRIA